jgi:hypothetical protein
MWKTLRVAVLLLVLVIVAAQAWLDRVRTTSWRQTVSVGAFPVNADGSDVAGHYIARLRLTDLLPVQTFVEQQARQFGITIAAPIELSLYPEQAAPPALPPGASWLSRAWWSLKLRWYRHRLLAKFNRAPPQIVLFLLYHDPERADTLPHSAGLQRGLSVVAHLFAARGQNAQNNIVIAHELLHTFGATDKYDPQTGAPSYPDGFADPNQQPRYPQLRAEIMAGRTPLTADQAVMPDSLAQALIGPLSAREIGWGSKR